MSAETLVQEGPVGGTALAATNGAAMATVPADQVTPGGLVHFAIANKMPAAELKELVVLHERMEDRSARKAFFEALRKFQRECPPIKKNKTAKIPTKGGGSYSFPYAELDEIERTVKPHLEANDFSYNFDATVDEKGVLLTNVCTLRHVDGHSERSSFTLPTSSESAMTAQQRFSAANNFAKRQTLSAVLGVSITDKEIPDDEVDPTVVTEDQATHLSDMIAETKANRARFLKHFGIESIEDLPAARYSEAVTALEQVAIQRRKESAQ